MNDIRTLPKWAQKHIEALEMRVSELAKRAFNRKENIPTPVFVKNLMLNEGERPLYLPVDRQVRFCVGNADWQYVDVRLKRTSEMRYSGQKKPETFVELMAGADIHIAPEVRNVSRIYVR